MTPPEAEVRIVYTAIEDLEGWPSNPKAHDIAEIRRSLRRFGFVAPIVVDENTGRIVAGHGRVRALAEIRDAGEEPPARVRVEAGRWLAPVLRGADFSNPDEASAYLLADNRLTEKGGWDLEELAEMLRETSDLVGTGYSREDADRLMAEAAAMFIAPDDLDFVGTRPPEDLGKDIGRLAKGNVPIAVGNYRANVTRDEWDTWVGEIRAAVGWDRKRVSEEILRRLGF